jgi:hypothetical protein
MFSKANFLAPRFGALTALKKRELTVEDIDGRLPPTVDAVKTAFSSN